MAAIDDKIAELNFRTTTSRTREEITQAATDAAEVASTSGGKITLSHSPNRIDGVQRNFVRIQHAAFTIAVEPAAEGQLQVSFKIGDYLRTRETLLYFIPVSPWMAPAYKPLKAFSEYLRGRL